MTRATGSASKSSFEKIQPVTEPSASSSTLERTFGAGSMALAASALRPAAEASTAVSRRRSCTEGARTRRACEKSPRKRPSPAPISTKSTGSDSSATSTAKTRASVAANAAETCGEVTKSPGSPIGAPRV